ncbi:competence protein ComGD [Metabacillus malikii]|uniref:Competence protein ComGD n=2 Tax=Metabacillus malikii TaxID=1504265 RepID=A0ABT9ZL73_9BACI|nr:competence type IV pilus minor pilin ComGD [Metabacillus malikii]MDQ0231965.1 competence protein ComGD [Metabacillus malikii]
MSIVLVANLVPVYEKKKIETFFEQFEKDIQYAQAYALINKKTVTILFRGNHNQYRVEQSSLNTPILVRDYDDNIKVEGGTLNNRVSYNRNGAVNSSGTLYVTYNDSKYKIIFYLGKGRVKVDKM